MRRLPHRRFRLMAVPGLVPGVWLASILVCGFPRTGIVLAAPGPADAGTASVRPLDAREVVVPIPGAERLRIDNPLGNVTVRAWDHPGSVHILSLIHISEPTSQSPIPWWWRRNTS